MKDNLYSIIKSLALVGLVLSLLIVAYLENPWQTIVAVIAGGCLSFYASMLIQEFASKEQSEMIKSVTLDAEGIEPLPEAFHKLSWLAFASKKAKGKEDKQTEWFLSKLTKIGGSGPRFVVYSFSVKNLMEEDVNYTATFVGSQGCVVCAVTKEHETTSTITFDTNVSSAGIYLASAFLTDWSGDRDITLAISGTKTIDKLSDLPENAAASFIKWYSSVDFRVENAYSEFLEELKIENT